MGLLIEVNTLTLTPEEAAGLIALLAVIHPGAVQSAALDKAATALGTGTVKPALTPMALADSLMASESARVAKIDPAITGEAPALTPAPALAPTTAPNGAELDAEGLPWDARIHSSAKGKLNNGTWKVARNIPADKVAQVKAELRAAVGAAAIPVGSPPAATGIVPIPLAPGTAAPAPATAPLAIQVDNGPAPAGAPPVSAYATCTFADAMGRVVDLTVAGVSMDAINAAVATVGLTQPRDLSLRPDLVPAAMAAMATLGVSA